MRRLCIVLAGVLAAVIAAGTIGINAGETPRKLRIIYTNDLSGYIEPCGCGGHRSGGLAQRTTLVRQLVKENPNCIIVDSGNQSDTTDRIELIGDVLADLKYDAIGMGDADVRMGDAFLKAMFDRNVPVLFAGPEAIRSTVPFVVRNIGGIRVGVVSFGGIQTEESRVRKSLYSAFRAARADTDILILLDQSNVATTDWIARNARRLGSPDVVIGSAARPVAGQGKMVGNTLVAGTAFQAKSVGVVDVEWAVGSAPKLSSRMIPLEDTIFEDEQVVARVKELLNNLNAQTAAMAAAPGSQPRPIAETGKPYYPSETCKACHKKQYDDWVKTPHATAVVRLQAQKRSVPGCIECHSERYRRTNDIVASNQSGTGVECASCHMESLPHGAERASTTVRAQVNPAGCRECHTPSQSPRFDVHTYMFRVAHGGKPGTATASAERK